MFVLCVCVYVSTMKQMRACTLADARKVMKRACVRTVRISCQAPALTLGPGPALGSSLCA